MTSSRTIARPFCGGVWFAALALVCQIGLPLVHAGHLALHASGTGLAAGTNYVVLAATAEADESHHPADCPVCRGLSRPIVTLPGTGFAPVIPIPPAAKLVACPHPTSFRSLLTSSVSPRGPPAA